METTENRYTTGLSSAQVAERVAAGKININADVKTKTIPRIFRDNLCTLFNLVNVILAAAVFWTGSYRNMLFLTIIVINVVIGIFQEVRAKLTVDKLSVITSTKAHVIRDGKGFDIPIDQIVLDDIITLGRGDQVPSDCLVIEGRCSANESLLTGESNLIPKAVDDALMSGSFIAAGTCKAKVTAVGADNYANSINNEAKTYKKVRSDIMESLNMIVKYVSIALIPLGALLFSKEAFFSNHGDVTSAILHTSAALVGMIPQGLILLTSSVLAVSVFRLAQHSVLVQQIYCVETLARVDVVCLDKTGTITTGEMEVDEVIPLDGTPYDDVLHALNALVAAGKETENETSRAVRDYVENLQEPPEAPKVLEGKVRVIPFSSEHKYSGVCYGSGAGNYAFGAAEFVLKDHETLPKVRDMIARLAGTRRVLVLARVQDFDAEDAIVGTVDPLGLVFIKDQIRTSARKTLEYFAEQGVRVNIISGDSVETVSKIAQSVGVIGADRYIDMSTVTTEEELFDAARDCRVFGRVSPDQKKKLVQALQEQGHIVAMTGDGVNDVLALHTSDCSVAMGSGSDAARSIAQLILLDDDFASMPHVVAEGRRSINNLQRSAVLFLTKTVFSAVFAVLFIPILAYNYPFAPIQITLISAFTIGLPSFVLALEPNKDRIRGRFLQNVVTRAVPGAVAIITGVVAAVVVGYINQLPQEEFQTICLMLTSIMGMNVVYRQSQPFNIIRVVLFIVCLSGLALGIFVFGPFFMLTQLSVQMAITVISIAAVLMVAFNLVYSYVIKRQKAYLDRVQAEQESRRRAQIYGDPTS